MLSIFLLQVDLWKQQIIYGNYKELSRLIKIYLTLFVLIKIKKEAIAKLIAIAYLKYYILIFKEYEKFCKLNQYSTKK